MDRRRARLQHPRRKVRSTTTSSPRSSPARCARSPARCSTPPASRSPASQPAGRTRLTVAWFG